MQSGARGAAGSGRPAHLRELRGGAAATGVESYDPAGEKFDPAWHEALRPAPAEGAEAGTVVEVIQKGYRLGRAGAARGPRGGERVGTWPRTSTRSWASPRRPQTRRSRRPTASWPANTTLTETPTTRSPRRSFKEVQGAYDTLSDPEKRKEYDSGGPFAGLGGGGRGPFGPGGGAGPGGFGDLGDIFSTIFSRGGGRGEPQQVRGRDLETEVGLSFDQAVNGAQISVTVPKAGRCPTCHGSGAKPGTTPGHLPALRRPRNRRPEPGLLLDQPALPAVRRRRADHRGPLPHLRRAPASPSRPSATR